MMRIRLVWMSLSFSLVLSMLLVSCTAPVSQESPNHKEEEKVIPEPETVEPPPPLESAEQLKYRVLDSFTTEAIKDITGRAEVRGYELPDVIAEWPDFALYIVVQNLDDTPGIFKVRYTLTTADKEAAHRQFNLNQRTPEEYEELNREYYEGAVQLCLEPMEAGVAICPPGGLQMPSDRVPFDHKHQILPEIKAN